MKLVIVESPAKAKTIGKYLGKDYEILASFGHIRDLPSKNGSVEPAKDFAMHYEISKDSLKHVSAIEKAAKRAESILLATDPDREGEAISWHIVEALDERGIFQKKNPPDVKRIVFHEITANAVRRAAANPRDVNMDLVNSQQARRALDYLVGFTLSPVLWRKLPGSRSAGRVQSVALRLICDREEDIEKFVAREYWTIAGHFIPELKDVFLVGRLAEYEGQKVEQFTFTNEKTAKDAQARLEKGRYAVSGRDTRRVARHPKPPFTTSTLQQEAARKLGFSAKKTMQIAQKLYEGVDFDGETTGLITYMRTDAVTVSTEAVAEARRAIGTLYGANYVPDSPRAYKTKTKNAQEAHEAIRPTSPSRTPDMLRRTLEKDFFALYELIWKRMVASQMASAALDQTTISIADETKKNVFRASGSVIVFDGFLRLYKEGLDDEQEEGESLLPPVKVGDKLTTDKIDAEQHFTQPPPRYSEASLVKRLEELGIGRPSTYASIISVLQDRQYVRLDKRRFIAEERGRLVTSFLSSYFPRYVEYDFTANLEEELDEVSNGKRAWKDLLAEFWKHFTANVDELNDVTISHVLEAMNEKLAYHLFPLGENGKPQRGCPECKTGELSLKVGKFGAFLGCSVYPECKYTKQLDGEADANEGATAGAEGDLPRSLGVDKDGKPVTLKKGPYGVYVQLGEDQADKKKDPAPKRLGVPKGTPLESVTLEKALEMLALPRIVGNHPETGKEISAGIGRFGPYVKHDGKYTSLKQDDPLTISVARAVETLSQSKTPSGELIGTHPESGKDIMLMPGRYGPYIKYDKANVPIPKHRQDERMTIDLALECIASAPEKKGNPAKKTTTRKAKKGETS
ncbi:MAG: type I DNA topoisomerase [Rickettsiales bacterium]